jgi:hypothetical protein
MVDAILPMSLSERVMFSVTLSLDLIGHLLLSCGDEHS